MFAFVILADGAGWHHREARMFKAGSWDLCQLLGLLGAHRESKRYGRSLKWILDCIRRWEKCGQRLFCAVRAMCGLGLSGYLRRRGCRSLVYGCTGFTSVMSRVPHLTLRCLRRLVVGSRFQASLEHFYFSVYSWCLKKCRFAILLCSLKPTSWYQSKLISYIFRLYKAMLVSSLRYQHEIASQEDRTRLHLPLLI